MERLRAPQPKKDPLRPFPVLEKRFSTLDFTTDTERVIELDEGDEDITIRIRAGVSATLSCTPHAELASLHLHVACEANARMTCLIDVAGANRIGINMQCDLLGQGSEADVRAVFHGVNESHHNMNIIMQHLAPDTKGNIAIRGVYEQKSRAVFSGLIKIGKAAQKTNSYFRDDILLLDGAIAESLPTLEIEANDVRASHGSTTSRLNDEQLFYLQSRGLSYEQARSLIIRGFLGKIPDA